MPDQREKFSLQEMIDNFDIKRVSTTGPVFDQEKLDWLNGVWIRESLSLEELLARFQRWATQNHKVDKLLPAVQQRVEKLSDVLPLVGFMFGGQLSITAEQFESKLELVVQRQLLQFLIWRFEQVTEWDRSLIELSCVKLSEALEIKLRDLMFPIFVAIAGTKQTIDIMDAMDILGSDLTRARLRHALHLLGQPSKKELKKWEKSYQNVSW